MPINTLHSRLLEPSIVESLEDSPVILIHGPRQCGKSTLATMVGEERGYRSVSFDDETTRAGAMRDPVGFIDRLPQRVILDEVQRVPRLFTAIKRAVDRSRTPGRFLLTGSSNILTLPTLSDSLAGRMNIERLHPFAQVEIQQTKSSFLNDLFAGEFPFYTTPPLREELVDRIVSGGYPPALMRRTERRRAHWYRDYIQTLVQRDVQDVARIHALDVLFRLLKITANQTAGLFNVSRLAAPFELSRMTIKNYVTLLEQMFLIERVSPWYTNRSKRLLKTPKIHVVDTGLACHLMGVDTETLRRDRTRFGALLETFVYQELRRLDSGHDHDHAFYHYRDRDQVEVDIVIERGPEMVVGVEVKAAQSVQERDFRGLQKLQRIAGARFQTGVVLYDGQTCTSFGDGLFAVPIRALWDAVGDGERRDS